MTYIFHTIAELLNRAFVLLDHFFLGLDGCGEIADLGVLAFYLHPHGLCFFAVGGYELVVD